MFPGVHLSVQDPSKKTNYWRRSQFLLGGIYGLILFAAVIFLIVQLVGQ